VDNLYSIMILILSQTDPLDAEAAAESEINRIIELVIYIISL
jgi:hypothetical protein